VSPTAWLAATGYPERQGKTANRQADPGRTRTKQKRFNSALLALVGVYSVIAYAVRQREREIAVRIAFGADSRRIVGLFIRQGGVFLLAGLAIGVFVAAGGAARSSALFGVRSNEPMTLGLTAAAFAFAGCIAIWFPASRAAATDPAAALTDE